MRSDSSSAPEADAVILVEVPRVRGVEDPEIVAELKRIRREMKMDAKNTFTAVKKDVGK